MSSEIKADKWSPASGTAGTIGDSGDTFTVPTGANFTVTDELKTNKISPASGTAFTLGDSGDTFTVPSGVTFANSGTATGFDGGLVPLAQTSATGATAAEVALESFADASKYAYYTVQIRFEVNTNGAGVMMRYRDGSSNIDGANYRSTIFEVRNLTGTVNTNTVNGGWGTSDPEFVDSCSVHTHSFIMDFFPKGHGITSGSGLNYNLSIFRGLSWEWTGSAHQLRTIISNFIYDDSSSTANGFYIYPTTGTFYKYDVRAYGVKLT